MKTQLPAIIVSAILSLSVFTLAPRSARAEHANIDLRVIGPDGEVAATSDQDPPPGGVNPHPKLMVKAGDPLALQFILTNVYPHGLIQDVSVHYVIVRSGKLGLKRLPDLDGRQGDIVTQGQATMNFKPKCRVGARMRFRIDRPGVYLVWLETLNTKSDHEHFSAIDLVVQ